MTYWEGAGSFPRSLQHGYWAAKKDQGHNFFLILAILHFGHSGDCWDSGDGPKMWAHEQWRNSEKIRLLLPPIREPLRYTPPRLHPICARSDRVSLVFLPPTRCTRHGVRYANRDPSIPAATHPKSNMPTTIPTCCWAMLGKKIPKPSRGRRRSSKILPSGRGLRGGRGYRMHGYCTPPHRSIEKVTKGESAGTWCKWLKEGM